MKYQHGTLFLLCMIDYLENKSEDWSTKVLHHWKEE